MHSITQNTLEAIDNQWNCHRRFRVNHYQRENQAQPTGRDMSSDSSESSCCGGTYGAGGSGGFGISITVPSGKLFSSSGLYLFYQQKKILTSSVAFLAKC